MLSKLDDDAFDLAQWLHRHAVVFESSQPLHEKPHRKRVVGCAAHRQLGGDSRAGDACGED